MRVKECTQVRESKDSFPVRRDFYTRLKNNKQVVVDLKRPESVVISSSNTRSFLKENSLQMLSSAPTASHEATDHERQHHVDTQLATPEDHPELFSGAVWPTLKGRPQQTIFDDRRLSVQRLEDASHEGTGVSAALVAYDRMMQQHRAWQTILRLRERRGQVVGAVYGVVSLLAADAPQSWSLPLTSCCLEAVGLSRADADPFPASNEASKSPQDVYEELLVEAGTLGCVVGSMINCAGWFAVLLAIAVTVGATGRSTAVAAAAIVGCVSLFCLVVALSCYYGHRRKRSRYREVVSTDLPPNRPSLLQLEVAERNARVLEMLTASGAEGPPPEAQRGGAAAVELSRTERARLERHVAREVAELVGANRRLSLLHDQHRERQCESAPTESVVNTAVVEV